MRQSHIVTALAVVFLLVVLGTARAETIEDTIEKVLPFAAGSRLQVSNTNGEIEVSAWDRDEIRVEAHKKVRSRSEQRAREAFDKFEVRISQTSDGVSIDSQHPRRGRSWWGEGVSSSVRYTIRVPARADLDLETVNGELSVDGVHGELNLDTTNGGIGVQSAGGQVRARTTNGSIDVELVEVSVGADMTFQATNGGITLWLSRKIQASLSARTTNGEIHTDFPITVQGAISRRRLEGEINGGGGRIEVRTTNGGIRIREL